MPLPAIPQDNLRILNPSHLLMRNILIRYDTIKNSQIPHLTSRNPLNPGMMLDVYLFLPSLISHYSADSPNGKISYQLRPLRNKLYADRRLDQVMHHLIISRRYWNGDVYNYS